MIFGREQEGSVGESGWICMDHLSEFYLCWNDRQKGFILLLTQQMLSSCTLWWAEDSVAQSVHILKRRRTNIEKGAGL